MHFHVVVAAKLSMEAESDVAEKTYTLNEVRQHADSKSLWITIADTVYDVTRFLEEVGPRKQAEAALLFITTVGKINQIEVNKCIL